MAQHRKRLKKLMQSIGIQRNDFQKKLWCMRNYDEWDYETIINWIRMKQDFKQNTSKYICKVDIYNQDGSLFVGGIQGISQQEIDCYRKGISR